MFGVDIVSHWDIGYSLFRDEDRFGAHFIESDTLSTDNPSLTALRGRMNVISLSAVLHQWRWEKQLEAAKRIATFSSIGGALVLEHQIGNVEGKAVMLKGVGTAVWRHNAASFTRLWEQAGVETGTKWETKARLLTWEDMGWDPKDQAWMAEGDRVVDFVVTRLS